MRIEEREVYAFDGTYAEGDIIIPKAKLNLHKEFIYKAMNCQRAGMQPIQL